MKDENKIWSLRKRLLKKKNCGIEEEFMKIQ